MSKFTHEYPSDLETNGSLKYCSNQNLDVWGVVGYLLTNVSYHEELHRTSHIQNMKMFHVVCNVDMISLVKNLIRL